MEEIRLFRRRLIPEECVELRDDKIVSIDEKRLITRWHTLKPRADFSHGCSCYFLEEGYKISKFLMTDGKLRYWYCDIIRSEFLKDKNMWIFTDLLADVILSESGGVQVLDLDELAEAAKRNLITSEELYMALERLNILLEIIYQGRFQQYAQFLDGV